MLGERGGNACKRRSEEMGRERSPEKPESRAIVPVRWRRRRTGSAAQARGRAKGRERGRRNYELDLTRKGAPLYSRREKNLKVLSEAHGRPIKTRTGST